MSRKIIRSLFVAALVVCGVLSAAAAQPNPQDVDFKSGPNERAADGAKTRAVSPRGSFAPAVIGTIGYDDGIVQALPATSSYMFGNQFNTSSGNPVQVGGTITALTFYMVSGTGGDNVFVSLYDAPVGTVAPFIDDHSVALNNGSAAFNTAAIPAPNQYVGASFLAGVWYVAGDTVGLGAGTVGAQGHHGIAINDIVGTDFQTLGQLNALVRATGDIVIPVELLGFAVE